MVYTRTGNWEEAEACFTRSLEQWRARGDVWREANTLGEMGMLHLARGDPSEARACLDEAWEKIAGHSGPHFELLRRELAGRREKLG
jgi:Flp pilus assembly protein TadD